MKKQKNYYNNNKKRETMKNLKKLELLDNWNEYLDNYEDNVYIILDSKTGIELLTIVGPSIWNNYKTTIINHILKDSKTMEEPINYVIMGIIFIIDNIIGIEDEEGLERVELYKNNEYEYNLLDFRNQEIE
jgi:hypothetical protein